MSTNSQFEWRQTSAPLANSRYDDIWFVNPYVGWAINSNGQILKTTDGGETWVRQLQLNSPTTYPRCLGFANAMKGWMGTTDPDNRLFRTVDGGANWDRVANLPGPAPAKVCGLWVVDENLVYLSGTNDPLDQPPGIFKTENGGETWQSITLGNQATILIDIHFSDALRGWVVGGKADDNVPAPTREDVKPVVLFTSDGGATWTDLLARQRDEFPLGEWGWKIAFPTPQIGYISLENFHAGAVLKSTDSGQTWVRLVVNDPQENKNLEGIGFINESEGWVGGWGDRFFSSGKSSHTSDGGASWQDANEIGRFINRFRFIGDPLEVGYACGKSVYRYAPAGAPLTFAQQPSAEMLMTEKVASRGGKPATISLKVPQGTRSLSVAIADRWTNHTRMLLNKVRPHSAEVQLEWDLIDDKGRCAPPGDYLFRVQADGHSESGLISVEQSVPDPPATAAGAAEQLLNPRDMGLRKYAMHRSEHGRAAEMLAVVNDNMASADLVRPASNPEAAARKYVAELFGRSDLPELQANPVNGEPCQFRCLVNKRSPLTKKHFVRFQPVYFGVPILGAYVSVELDETNQLVSVSAETGEPVNVDPYATISAGGAREIVLESGGKPSRETPELYFYFDSPSLRWKLVYLVPNVEKHVGGADHSHGVPQLVDYLVDAHSGKIVDELPRSTHATVLTTDREFAADELGDQREIGFSRVGGVKVMRDARLNVETYDFGFRSYRLQGNLLPGDIVTNPPAWSPAAVSAHANTTMIAQFLLDEFGRDGLDDAGGAFVSSVNVVEMPGVVWRNAARLPSIQQMIYGQRRVGDRLISYAVAGDVIIHEVFHGVTDTSARIVYRNQSGALNESYSDIFGVIISNFDTPDVADWNWEIGEDLGSLPLRDISRPGRFGQPAHMRDYINTTADNGGVHANSGIHNKAAHNLLTAVNGAGDYVFTARQAAQMFYVALVQHLGRFSVFRDSRRAVDLAAMSLFEDEPDLSDKLSTIAAAFDAVGVVAA